MCRIFESKKAQSKKTESDAKRFMQFDDTEVHTNI